MIQNRFSGVALLQWVQDVKKKSNNPKQQDVKQQDVIILIQEAQHDILRLFYVAIGSRVCRFLSLPLFIIAILFNILYPLKKGHARKYVLDHPSTSDYYKQRTMQHHRNYHNHYAQFNVQIHHVARLDQKQRQVTECLEMCG